MPAGHRVHLGITDEQMPAMQRLWDEGLCDLEWTRKDLVHKIATCHQCPVRALCARTGADEEAGVWGGEPHGSKAGMCKRGHWLTGDNVAFRKNGKYTYKACKTCRRIAERGRHFGRTTDEQWIHEMTQEAAA
jgi:hypothetical protein